NRIATGSLDGSTRLWSLEQEGGEKILDLPGHIGAIWDIAFSPDGQSMLTASVDETIRIWDVSTFNNAGFFVLSGSDDRLNKVALESNGRYLATAGHDGIVKLWTMPEGRELFTLSAHNGPVWDITFSPDGQSLASAGADNIARVWDIRASLASSNNSARLELSGHDDQSSSLGNQPGIRQVAFSPDGETLLTAGADGIIKLWNINTGQETGVFKFEPTRYGVRGVTSAAFSPNGEQLAALTEGPEAMVRVWEVETGEKLFEASRHVEMDASFDLEYSPDGKHLAISGLNITITIYDVLSRQVVSTITGYKSAVMGIAYSHDGFFLATSHAEGTVKVWNLTTGQELLTLPGNSNPVSSVVFSPDGEYLITSGFDGTARVFVLDLNELIRMAHSRVTRELTEQECLQYLHTETC
ncbi:MAG: WD40 repeat domain-containing protein, partial [Chloroflexi bacterium]